MSLMKPPNKKIMAKSIITPVLPCSGAKPGNEANEGKLWPNPQSAVWFTGFPALQF